MHLMKLDTCRDLHLCDYRIRRTDFIHVSECRSANLQNFGITRALIIPSDTKKATREEVDLILEFAA
eukprot:1311618-Prorocentrum_lima.AAC.1